MEVVAILPHISFDKTMLNFWECQLNEQKFISITIHNKNEELPADFSFSKNSSFFQLNQIVVLSPQMKNYMSK